MGEESAPASRDHVPEVGPEAKPSAPVAKARPKYETVAEERLKTAVKKLSKPLAELVARDANEAETRLLVTDFLCDGLGYDKFADLTMEHAVKGEYADYGIRVDKELLAFVEVKRVGTRLAMKHLHQAQSYAVNEGVEWIILTNAAQWHLYHLTFSQPVLLELVLSVDLLADSPVASKAKVLFYLTRESFKKGRIDERWKAHRATSPESLGGVLRSKSVVEAIRKELWRQTNHRLESQELVKLLDETVLRPECLKK